MLEEPRNFSLTPFHWPFFLNSPLAKQRSKGDRSLRIKNKTTFYWGRTWHASWGVRFYLSRAVIFFSPPHLHFPPSVRFFYAKIANHKVWDLNFFKIIIFNLGWPFLMYNREYFLWQRLSCRYLQILKKTNCLLKTVICESKNEH